MNKSDIRWKQRYENLTISVDKLRQALELHNPDIFQRAGMIQFFEMSFELSWNTLKDYLEYEGIGEIRTPRGVIKKAFEVGLMEDGHKWLQALEDRNLTSHTYNEQKAREVEKLIRDIYFPLIDKLVCTMNTKFE